MITVKGIGQNGQEPEGGLKAVYAGLGIGTDFQNVQSTANLRFVFHNDPLIYLDYTSQAIDAPNIPDDYIQGVSILPQGQPKGLLRSFSIMGGKEFKLTQNLYLVTVGGFNYSRYVSIHFEKVNKDWWESNYKTSHNFSEHGGGFIAKCGLTWVATSWFGLSLELVGNLNDLQNYGGASLTVHLGWMGKEGWSRKLRLDRID